MPKIWHFKEMSIFKNCDSEASEVAVCNQEQNLQKENSLSNQSQNGDEGSHCS